ncbi:TIGR03620 family F420-dependent LLM class oxidoreductase [Microbacterium sp. HD4P20]|uniref:TIGR03620 family F420-dependent LLM class oxidoreductase n=1 Tax=Microbacterium sp. HD4P20 TaxID=2864874 RepID=UPI0020A374E6|nr:TIGR03620 family F420-dependent LLM class oxidoreductase [Microbacterium sp. HD4P20]MCP2635403.1 TIGR03620 family F420-dependent LLM class oxidoreductase [Microbacterium sp. HD4P20]
MSWTERLGAYGVWRGKNGIDVPLARTIEQLGFGTIWQGSSPGSDLRAAEDLLDGTESVVVATGIVNIWKSDPSELADSYHRIVSRHPGRLLLGIGSGHREATPQRTRPLDAISRYLDVLDAGAVPSHDRVISALGPKMLAIAADRSAGTHPYLTVPPQTREAREALGPGSLIAPEQTVVVDPDPVAARRAARDFLQGYLSLSNYSRTMRRAGFSDDDFAGGGSDRLVDAIVLHGDPASIARGIRAHIDAGADHVCVQVQPIEGIVAALSKLAVELRLTGPAAHRSIPEG